MNEREIRAHIFLTLARLYEDPIRRKQYFRFTFEPSDKKLAHEILAKLNKNLVVEQIQPEVVRLTELGYQLIQYDLNQLRREAAGRQTQPSARQEMLQPPPPEEIESISNRLGQPDYISASRFTEGLYQIYWATDGIKQVTGYTMDELNKAGGVLAVIRGSRNLKKLEQIALTLLDDNEVSDEIDIITKSGRKRTVQFVVRPRYDSNGQITGSINAVKDVTSTGGL